MIDEKDRRILDELMEDARKSVVDISNDLGIPRATVQERIQRMKQSGVIRKFVAIPDYSRLGRPVTAFILVSFMPGTVSQRELGEADKPLTEGGRGSLDHWRVGYHVEG